MRVVWTPEAERDRLETFSFIAQDDPLAAIDLDERLGEIARGLADFPLTGHAGQIAGTREIVVHPHYRLLYEVDGTTVFFLAVVHAARLWPPAQ